MLRSRYFPGRIWSQCKDVKAKKHVLHYFLAYFYMSRSRSRIRVKEKIPGAGAGQEWTGSATLALSEEMYIFIFIEIFAGFTGTESKSITGL